MDLFLLICLVGNFLYFWWEPETPEEILLQFRGTAHAHQNQNRMLEGSLPWTWMGKVGKVLERGDLFLV